MSLARCLLPTACRRQSFDARLVLTHFLVARGQFVEAMQLLVDGMAKRPDMIATIAPMMQHVICALAPTP